jgi:hypothetical protein
MGNRQGSAIRYLRQSSPRAPSRTSSGMSRSSDASLAESNGWASPNRFSIAASPWRSSRSSGPLTPSSAGTSATATEAPRASSSMASLFRLRCTSLFVAAFESKAMQAVRFFHATRSRSGEGPATYSLPPSGCGSLPVFLCHPAHPPTATTRRGLPLRSAHAVSAREDFSASTMTTGTDVSARRFPDSGAKNRWRFHWSIRYFAPFDSRSSRTRYPRTTPVSGERYGKTMPSRFVLPFWPSRALTSASFAEKIPAAESTSCGTRSRENTSACRGSSPVAALIAHRFRKSSFFYVLNPAQMRRAG